MIVKTHQNSRSKKNNRSYRVVSNQDYLAHYGVSINDGAPGVGTGNWRRGGGVISKVYRKAKDITHKYAILDSVTSLSAGNTLKNAYWEKQHRADDVRNEITKYRHGDNIKKHAKKYMKEELHMDDNVPLTKDFLDDKAEDFFFDYEVPGNQKLQALIDSYNETNTYYKAVLNHQLNNLVKHRVLNKENVNEVRQMFEDRMEERYYRKNGAKLI